jgi:hypothetical protein
MIEMHLPISNLPAMLGLFQLHRLELLRLILGKQANDMMQEEYLDSCWTIMTMMTMMTMSMMLKLSNSI